MLRNQNGLSVYTVLSVILAIALVTILALPNFYNLDKNKNIDDCTNYMKSIWVAATDYIKDTGTDFNGDLGLLLRTKKLSDPKTPYLQSQGFCPETSREKTPYLVYGKYIAGVSGTEIKKNIGVIVICPNLAGYPKHFLPKSFYENMDPSPLQNMMTEDIDFIDTMTKSNGKQKMDAMLQYINIWKTNPKAYELRRADSNALKAMIFPDKVQPTQTEDQIPE
ncbi:MAG TPA: hypothetical protein PL124_11995 [Candidatus Cloacimonadota bacterium]|nr:hypothetical protein [Candidatus Cloacimonadota bacterium]HPS40131.1 hypothetical protein [Candidatus Cloacimonadota bacterium]